MSRREQSKAKAEFQEGLNHAIHSSEKADEAGARSIILRAPLHDPNLEGAPSKGRIRPHWVGRHLKRLEELGQRVAEAVSWEKAKEREAAEVPRYWPWLIVVFILIVSDGLLLGPVISNAVGGFENEKLILAMGLGTAFIIAFAGYGSGWAVRAFWPGKGGKLVAALVGGLEGLVAGAMIGYAGDGTLIGTLVRMCLTGMSCLGMATVHFIVAEAQEVWGAVKIARKQRRDYESERGQLERELNEYQESAIRANESFNRAEADRHEGLKSGEQARTDWVRPSYKNFVLLFALLFSALTLTPNARAGEPTQTIMVLDITDSTERVVLAEAAQKQVQLGYGDSIRVLLMGCKGLTPAFEATVPSLSKPRHRQALEEIKARMAATLKDAVAQAPDTQCTPLVDTLLMLAAEFKLRQASGNKLRLLVASDFETNSDRIKSGDKPFEGVEVTVVLNRPLGRNTKQRLAALDFIQRLFAGATLSIAN